MENISISGLTLYYDREEIDYIDQMVLACERSVRTIMESWRLETPADCRVYILNRWPRCVFLGAPFSAQILLGLTLPLWYAEFRQRWAYAGGWSQGYGERQVVGIKSPRLIAGLPDSFGESIFIKEDNLDQKILSILSHELTHACSAHLKLPTWMHEGLAMVSADHSLERPTVLTETLQLIQNAALNGDSIDKLNMKSQDRDQIILLYVRGYWLTRLLVDTQPGLVDDLLKEQQSHQELEGRIAEKFEVPYGDFWSGMDQLVLDTYNLELT